MAAEQTDTGDQQTSTGSPVVRRQGAMGEGNGEGANDNTEPGPNEYGPIDVSGMLNHVGIDHAANAIRGLGGGVPIVTIEDHHSTLL